MNTKQFSQELHDDHDPIVRTLLIERLPYALGLLDPVRFSWCEFKDGSKYGVDLLGVTEQGEIIHAEGERKLEPDWNIKFPYDTLDIPYRKKKFALSANPTVFVVVNHDLTQMGVVPASRLLMSPTKFKSNKYVKNEQFFAVPVEYVRFCPLKGWK